VVSVMENRRTSGTGTDGNDEKRRRLRLFKKRDRNGGSGVDLGAEAAPPVQQELVNYQLNQYRQFQKRPDIADILHQNELRLVQLSYRSFPLHRPLIKQYLELIEAIEKGSTKGLDERFEQLVKTRAGLVRSGQMAEDLMNLHDATEADQSSGEFDGYFKLFERLRSAKPERKDEISKYLDRIQAEFE